MSVFVRNCHKIRKQCKYTLCNADCDFAGGKRGKVSDPSDPSDPSDLSDPSDPSDPSDLSDESDPSDFSFPSGLRRTSFP